jgi:16S rRNA (guanine527-N7)-methyltransferase
MHRRGGTGGRAREVTSRAFRERLGRRARRAGVAVPAPLRESLEAYYRLLALWNTRINLTALNLESADEAIDRLLIEPVAAARWLPPPPCTLLDIGSGGGSPAIPLKLAVPTVRLIMVEAKTRKSAFLREAIRQLPLADTTVETARFEELLTRPDLHEAADIVTVRAVRIELRVLMSLQAFLRPGGCLFLFRGPSGRDLPEMLTPPLVWQNTHPLVDAAGSRLVVVRKAAVGQTR